MPPLPDAFLTRPVAHRGLHDAEAGVYENTLAAVRAAADAGYGIEIDVRITADGEAVTFHDDTLDRLTAATGPTAAKSAAELTALSVAGTDERIPTFAETLAAAGTAPLLIEVKTERDGPIGPLEDRIVADLRGHPGPVALMSFNPRSIAHLSGAAPDIARGLITCAFADTRYFGHIPAEVRARLAAIADFDAVGASFVSHYWPELSDAPVTALKARGVPILCWTTRSPEEDATARRVATNVTFEGYRPG